MADEAHWRDRYYASLEKLEAEQGQWLALEELLRRLIIRLCIAGRGHSESLDAELQRVGSHMRKPTDVGTLEPLLKEISAAISALDDEKQGAAPATKPAAEPHAAQLLEQVLQQLKPDAQQAATWREWVTRLAADSSAPTLAGAAQCVADWVRAQQDRLGQEKADLEQLLQRLNLQLGDLSRDLESESSHDQQGQLSRHNFSQQVMGEMRAMSSEVRSATELSTLKSEVEIRLRALSQHVSQFREHDHQRALERAARTQLMATRIQTLERESVQLQQALKRQQAQSMTDPLTGIPNRLAWQTRAEQLHEFGHRAKTPRCLATWDVDHFKRINDHYGHPAGDKVLRMVAQQLKRNLRQGDFLARYGGEEFVMILEGLPPEEGLRRTDALRQMIGDLAFHFRQTPVRVTASCGVTVLKPEDTLDTAFARADQALYQAKHTGRNRCVLA